MLAELKARLGGTGAPARVRLRLRRDGSVSVAIPAGRLGTVYVRAEGQTHELSATASEEIPAGTPVRVVGLAGMGLVVARLSPSDASTVPPAPVMDVSKGEPTDA